MVKIISLICLLATTAFAQDMYIGPYEAEAQFDSISPEKIARIRQQRVLFGSRSWGGAVANSYIGNLGSEYALNWKPSISLSGTDTIPHTAFGSPGVVHFRGPDITPDRWQVFGDIIRGRNGFKEFGPEIDIAFQFIYDSGTMWETYYPLFDSLRNEYPNIKFGICTHHVASDSTAHTGWNIDGNHYSDSVLANYLGVVPIIDLRMIGAIGPNGDTATFEYQGKTYPQLHQDWTTPDHIHLTDYTTMCKSFYMMLDHLTPDTGAFDTTGIPIDSGMINVYIDPSATGAGDGSSWDNAYNNLGVAELLQRQDLVALDASITFKCRGGIDNDGVTFEAADWTVDESHFITIEVAPEDRHDGTRGTGYVIDPPRYDFGFWVKVPYTVIDGVSLDANRNLRGGFRMDAASCIIKNCLVYDITSGTYSGIALLGSARGTVVANCLVYGIAANGISMSYSQDLALYNNTVLNCGRAISINNHPSYPVSITNCYFGSAAGDSVIKNSLSINGVTFTTTHTSTGEFGTIQTDLATDAGTYFTNITPGEENVHITYDSELYATATDLGDDAVFPFNYDAAGEFRNNGAYSVGAYEVSTVSVDDVLPGAEYAPVMNAHFPVYDISGNPVSADKTGIYLMWDADAKVMKKVMVIK